MVAGDAIDVRGDEIVAGSNRHKDPLAVYSISMSKVIQEISSIRPESTSATPGTSYRAVSAKIATVH